VLGSQLVTSYVGIEGPLPSASMPATTFASAIRAARIREPFWLNNHSYCCRFVTDGEGDLAGLGPGRNTFHQPLAYIGPACPSLARNRIVASAETAKIDVREF